MNKVKEFFQKNKFTTKDIAVIAILIALHIVFSRFLSINAYNIKIGFTFVPVMIAAYLYKEIGGVLVGALGDLIGALVFPIGPYFPGFTLTCAITGLAYGIAMHKGFNFKKMFVAILFNQAVCSLLLNTYWISFLYHAPYTKMLISRIPQVLIGLAVEFVFAYFVLGKAKILERLKLKK